MGEKPGTGHIKGVRFSYEQVKQQFGRSGSWRIGFKYSFGDYLYQYEGVKNDNSYYNNGNSSSLPSNITVDGVTSYSTYQFEIHQKMYFGNGNIQYGGAYIFAGFGMNLSKHKTKYSYDENNYSLIDKKEANNEYTRQFSCNFGGGYEFNLDIINLFIEGDFNLPFFAINDEGVFEFEFIDPTPKFWSLSAGVRIHLF